MYVSFIAKKSSKSKKLIDKIIERLHQQNITEKHLVEFTEYAGHAVDLAEGLARKKVDVVVAVGGDGTLNEVLNGIIRVSTNVILALIPMGTANDFSKTIGVNKNVDQFISLIKNNMIRTIDIGKVTCLNKGGKIERYFINIADAGLGGYVANTLNNSKKLLGANFTYFKAIIKGMIRFKKPLVNIKVGEIDYNGKLMSIAICNGTTFGSGLIISPEAILNDAKFHVTLLGNVTLFDYFRNLKKLKKGIKLTHPHVHYYTASKIQLNTYEMCEVEADGEYVGGGETTFEILPKSIQFLAPKSPYIL
jgi:diacylglycerol kinase (ATP)